MMNRRIIPVGSEPKPKEQPWVVIQKAKLKPATPRTVAELAEELSKKYPELVFVVEKSRFWHTEYRHCHGVRMTRFKVLWKLSGAKRKFTHGFGCIYCGKTEGYGVDYD